MKSMKNNQQNIFSEMLIFVPFALFAVVSATSSEFKDIPDSGCPQACYCNQSQHLVDCGYRSLVTSPPYLPRMLHYYKLAGNRILWISADNLLGLDELVSLDLSENFISELPADLFIFTPKLSILRLDSNELESVPASSLLKLHNLQQLFLSRNRIVSLSSETEFTSRSLLTFDLSSNEIVEVPDLFLDRFPQLRDLRLSRNHLTSLDMKKLRNHEHGLEILDISSNRIERILWNDVIYHNLKVLNASNNLLRMLDASWFTATPNLNILELCANLFGSIANNTFYHAFNLHRLGLCQLPNMQYIDAKSFAGLPLLEELDLSSSYNLSRIHQDAFVSLRRLNYLNVRGNRLRTLQLSAAGSNLEAASTDVYLSGSRWLCDCRLKWIYDAHLHRGSNIGQDIVCSAPPELRGSSLFGVQEDELSCETSEQQRQDVDQIVRVRLSTSVILHCLVDVDPESQIVWTTCRGTVIQSTTPNSHSEHLLSSEPFSYTVFNRAAVMSEEYVDGQSTGGRFILLRNGSLVVNNVSRTDTGRYVCSVVGGNENVTFVVELRLDYGYMSSVMLFSLVVGGASSVGFLLVAMIVGTVRHLAHSCSADERKKRRSLRELLNQMRNNAQFDRLSAYRAAQLDKLSAFKSATMDHLSSFTSHRIGRLKKYKQSTVSSVLHHLERMREHYSVQMDHIKTSYRLNAARLRHSYMARFRESKSTSVRKQYRASVARARDYTSEQIVRLRAQYKLQQQYLLKLLELIDVGSCVSSSVEAECIRAESAIFDATVEFDQEARPSYANRPDDRGLFASTSSLPEDYRHFVLPTASPSSVDFCDVDDYCMDDMAVELRATSAPSVHAYKLAAACTGDDGFLRARSNSATDVYYQKALSSPAVATAVINRADIELSHGPEPRDV